MERQKIIIGVAVVLILAVMFIGISMGPPKSLPAQNLPPKSLPPQNLPTGMVSLGSIDGIGSFVDMDSVERINGKVRFQMKAYKTQTPSNYAIYTYEADPADGRVMCVRVAAYENGIFKGYGQYQVKNPYPQNSPLSVARDYALKKAGY